MFKHDMKEKQTSRVEIDDLDPEVIRTALSYMYTGYLDPDEAARGSHRHLLDVVAFADKYEIRPLVEACFDDLYLMTNTDNVVEMFTLVNAANFEDDTLRKKLIKYIAM
jgi:hypothetical protein